MAFDPLKEIDPNRFYLDVQEGALVAVEAKRMRGEEGGNVAWPESALTSVVQFLNTHPLQEFLSRSFVLPIERVIIDATEKSHPACRRLFQKHLLENNKILLDALRKVPKEKEEATVEALYTVLKQPEEERDRLLSEIERFGTGCDDWEERITFFMQMNQMVDQYKDRGMTENERNIYIESYLELQTRDERDHFRKALKENYPDILKWFLDLIQSELREEFVKYFIVPVSSEKMDLLRHVTPLFMEDAPNHNRMVWAAVYTNISVDRLKNAVEIIRANRQYVSDFYIPFVLVLLSRNPPSYEEALQSILKWLPITTKKVTSMATELAAYCDCVTMTQQYLNRFDAADMPKILEGAKGFKEWFIDIPEMSRFKNIERFQILIDLPDRLTILSQVEPYFTRPSSINQNSFFRTLIKMLKNAKSSETKDITTLCLAAHKLNPPDARRVMESYFPSTYEVIDYENKSKLFDALLKLVVKTGPINHPIEQIVQQVPTMATVNILWDTESFSPLTIECLFVKLLQGIPEEQYYNAVVPLIKILKQVIDKSDFVERCASIPKEFRVQVISLLDRYHLENTIDDIELIVKTLPLYNALEKGGFFNDVSAVDRYLITKLAKNGLTSEQIEGLIEAKVKIPHNFEWAYVALFLAGVTEEDCLKVLANVHFESHDFLYGFQKHIAAILLRHIFKDEIATTDQKIEIFKKAFEFETRISWYHNNITDEAFLGSLFAYYIEESFKNFSRGEVSLLTRFEYLPDSITVPYSSSAPRFEDKLAIVKLMCTKWAGEQRSDYIPAHMRMFYSRLKLEPEDIFLLGYQQALIPPLNKLNLCAVPTVSPQPKPDLTHILDAIHPPPVGEVRTNNQRIIDSTLNRRDNDWPNFGPKFFEELQKYLEWDYHMLTAPDADSDNVSAILSSFSESTRRCPSDWKNEAEFQYSRVFATEARDYLQSLAGNVRRSIVGAIILELATEAVRTNPKISFVKALQWFSDNHRRNLIVSWLVSRSVPGSDTINKDTDPYLPNNMDLIGYYPTIATVEALFDKHYTLRALCEGIEAVINDPKFTQQNLLLTFLEQNPLAENYQKEEWEQERFKLVFDGAPEISIPLTDLTPLFAIQSGNPILTVEQMAVKVPDNPGQTLQCGNIRQFLKDRKNTKELQKPLENWLADSKNGTFQRDFQEAFTAYERQLEPRKLRDALKKALIPCKFNEKDDALLDSYFAGETTYREVVRQGINNGKKDAFARSMIDPATNKFKKEALFLMFLQAGIYEPRG